MTLLWSSLSGTSADPLIVLVHGSMDRSAGLLKLSRRIVSEYEVMRYDRRGYGRSIDNGGPFTMSDQVDDLAGLINGSSRRAALVFGHSYGGNVALALADRHPDLVDAVSVYEAPMSWSDWWPGNSAGAAALSLDDSGDAAEAFLRRLMGDDGWEQLSGSKQAMRRAEGAAMIAELADLRQHQPWSGSNIDVPVLAMCGDLTKPHHQRAANVLTELLNDCRAQTVPGAGHFGPYSHPDLVAAQLLAFIRTVG